MECLKRKFPGRERQTCEKVIWIQPRAKGPQKEVPGRMWPEASHPLGPFILVQWLRFRKLLLSFMAEVRGCELMWLLMMAPKHRPTAAWAGTWSMGLTVAADQHCPSAQTRSTCSICTTWQWKQPGRWPDQTGYICLLDERFLLCGSTSVDWKFHGRS